MWLKTFCRKTFSVQGIRLCSTEAGPSKPENDLPESFLSGRKSIWQKYPIQGTSQPRQAWVEDLSSSKWIPKSGNVVQLHPDVWAVKPR
jgi:hypothetical protein